MADGRLQRPDVRQHALQFLLRLGRQGGGIEAVVGLGLGQQTFGLVAQAEILQEAEGLAGRFGGPGLERSARGQLLQPRHGAHCRHAVLQSTQTSNVDDLGEHYCTTECADDSECPSTFHCRSGVCARGQREGVGASCSENDDCDSPGFCASRGNAHWCTEFCPNGDECPLGFECVAVGTAQLCAPTSRLVGESCADNDECVSGVCSGDASEMFCTRACSADNPCTTGFACVRDESGSTRCEPPATETAPGGVSGGGCTVSGASTSTAKPILLAFLGLMALFLVWRRERR